MKLERHILNRQLGEDLRSAFPEGIPDEMALEDLLHRTSADEVYSDQRGMIRRVFRSLLGVDDFKTVGDIRDNVWRVPHIRNIGDQGIEFLSGLLEIEIQNK